MENCVKVIGDYVYQWDRYTNLLTRSNKGSSIKTIVAEVKDPSKIERHILKDFRG